MNKSVQDVKESHSTPGYRRYVLLVLTLVYAINFIDRQILVILQESIKADMRLSDARLGILTGFAFAVFYVSVGIPIARWADLGNRRNIVALAITVWSGMTAISGLAQNYVQLLLARIGVGVGEAGGSPPAHSMISDYYPPRQRGTALSIYSIGIHIGVLLGFLIGGWINHAFGWRVAFFVVGVPGFLFALLVRYTIREPRRGQYDNMTGEAPSTFRDTLYTLWHLRSFRFFSLGAGLVAFAQYGIGNFLPSFLIRSHGFDSVQAGTSLALIIGIGGAAGTFLGGFLADRLGVRDKRWYLWICGIPAVINLPLVLTSAFSGQTVVVLVFMFLSTATLSFYLGPTIAISHSLVKPGMRAMASAILFLILNLIGLGCGPVTVGLLSDALAPTLGTDSLRYAIAITSLMGLISGACFIYAAHLLPRDLERKNAIGEGKKEGGLNREIAGIEN